MAKKLVELTWQEMQEHLDKDPIRPHITAKFRTDTPHRAACALENKGDIEAIVCLSFGYGVPIDEGKLAIHNIMGHMGPDFVIVPYTMWSYKKGAGSDIINRLLKQLKREYKGMDKSEWPRLVTMSPKTEMAQNFHIKNGAELLAENESSNNFEYKLY